MAEKSHIEIIQKNKLFVLSYGDKARESKVSSAHFKVDLNADHQVKIYTKKH